MKGIRIKPSRILLYILVLFCIALTYTNYRQYGDIQALSLRLDQSIKATNGWAYWVEDNMLTLEKYQVVLLSQNVLNKSLYQQSMYLTRRVYALEQIITEGLEEENSKPPKSKGKIIGNFYYIREGQLSILRSCEKDIGI